MARPYSSIGLALRHALVLSVLTACFTVQASTATQDGIVNGLHIVRSTAVALSLALATVVAVVAAVRLAGLLGGPSIGAVSDASELPEQSEPSATETTDGHS